MLTGLLIECDKGTISKKNCDEIVDGLLKSHVKFHPKLFSFTHLEPLQPNTPALVILYVLNKILFILLDRRTSLGHPNRTLDSTRWVTSLSFTEESIIHVLRECVMTSSAGDRLVPSSQKNVLYGVDPKE